MLFFRLFLFHIYSVVYLQTTGKTVDDYSLTTTMNSLYAHSYNKTNSKLLLTYATKKTRLFPLVNKENPLHHVYAAKVL